VERAFSVQLRAFLRHSNDSRVRAASSGAIAALCLQSATAVAVLVSNFSVKGGIGLIAGMAMLLGADIGSAIVSQILLVRQDFLIPLLLLCGIVLFFRSSKNEIRQFGRILIGVALIFVSLDMIRTATGPLIDSPGAVSVMRYLGGDIVTSFVIGAFLAWAMHSSVASVLFFVTLMAQGLLPASGAAAMVLGANAGGAILAYVLTLTAPIAARRMVVVNLVLRGGGAAFLLLVMSETNIGLNWLGSTEERQIINLHLVFNVGLALVCLPVLKWIAMVSELLMTDRNEPTISLNQISALDPSALDRPARALACVAREILKMGEETEIILRSVIMPFQGWDEATANELNKKTIHVQNLHEEVKRFLAQVSYSQMDETEKEKYAELANIAYSLETAADAIGNGLVDLARQLHTEKLRFSDDGLADIEDFHDRILSNTQLALSVFMSGAPDAARQLVRAKEKVRIAERKLQKRHLARLRADNSTSFETSRLHQESLRLLKNVNTAFAVVGYSIAIRSGDLLSTQLSKKSKRENKKRS
jgi:phosphate:Na+ symporter